MLELWRVITDSLTLDVGLWRELKANPDEVRFQFALWVVVLAGVSEAVSQSVVLFMNRVKPRRFVLSLLTSAVIFAAGYFFYVASVELIASVVFERARLEGVAFKMIALAYAPLVLSVITLIPYFGQALALYLNVYHFLALLVAVAVSYALSVPQALACLAASWLLLTLLKGTVGRPLVWLSRSLRNRAAGTTLLTRQELRERYADMFRDEG